MNWEQFKKYIDKTLENISSNDKQMYDMIGKEVSEQIKKRTRLGYGADKLNAQQTKLAKLSESYVQFRKGKLAFATNKDTGNVYPYTPLSKPTLSADTSPTKSNLTLTGDMLDDITYESKKDSVNITFRSKESMEKAAWAHEGSKNRPKRQFMNISSSEYNKISKLLKDYLVKKLA